MATAQVQIGQTLGNYKVVGELGEGGMGVVFEAVHTKLEHQRAALKTLTIKLRRESVVVQRFRKEAESVSRMNHPGIVRIYDMGDLEDGSPYYIMEFVEGSSLDRHIEAANKRPGGCLGLDFLPTMVTLASAVAHAHERGIVHRDLKPNNVMVVADSMSPNGLGPKLLDFGIAKIAGDAQTRTGVQLGTPSYMAPEQIQDPARVGPQADVYGLGTILYEVLSGQFPFDSREAMAVIAKKLYEAPRPLALFAPSLPPKLLELTMRMLAREPAERPEMAEVEIELRLIAGMPLPRQTGTHKVPESSDPTADVKPEDIRLVNVPAPTPSEMKAHGEKSPRPEPLAKSPANAPLSISDVPSVPVQMPPYTVGPKEPTAKAAPTPLPVVEKAGALAKTRFDWTPRRIVYLVGGAVALSTIAVVIILHLPQPAPAPMTTGAVRPVSPLTTVAPVSMVPPSPASTPPSPAPPPSSNVTSPAPKTAALPTPKAASQQSSAPVVQIATRSSEPKFPVESCIITDMSKVQRDRLLSALRSKGVKLRPGERLALSGFPHYPQITAAPSSLNPESAEAYELTGLLKDANLPAQVEIKCRR
jgi:serine/threonine-protein kinase